MSKKRRRPQPAGKDPRWENAAAQESAPLGVPKFEIGVKGDEFDIKYTKAAAAPSAEADSLLRSLSREYRSVGFSLLNFAVVALVWIMLALSFAFLSREGNPPRLRQDNLADGSYTAGLSAYYKDGMHFAGAFKRLGSSLGFCEAPAAEEEIPDVSEEDGGGDEGTVPEVTLPAETEPAVTTPPETTEAPTSAPITEETVPTIPDTRVMYASDTLNIRLSPDSDSMILGYFSVNQEVDVIEIMGDGWASILYNGSVAYVSADFLGENTVATTRATRRTTTEPPETEPPTQTEPETSPEETSAEETTEATTTRFVYMEPEMVFTRRTTATEPPETETGEGAEPME